MFKGKSIRISNRADIAELQQTARYLYVAFHYDTARSQKDLSFPGFAVQARDNCRNCRKGDVFPIPRGNSLLYSTLCDPQDGQFR
jgi:hypothetical protein